MAAVKRARTSRIDAEAHRPPIRAADCDAENELAEATALDLAPTRSSGATGAGELRQRSLTVSRTSEERGVGMRLCRRDSRTGRATPQQAVTQPPPGAASAEARGRAADNRVRPPAVSRWPMRSGADPHSAERGIRRLSFTVVDPVWGGVAGRLVNRKNRSLRLSTPRASRSPSHPRQAILAADRRGRHPRDAACPTSSSIVFGLDMAGRGVLDRESARGVGRALGPSAFRRASTSRGACAVGDFVQVEVEDRRWPSSPGFLDERWGPTGNPRPGMRGRIERMRMQLLRRQAMTPDPARGRRTASRSGTAPPRWAGHPPSNPVRRSRGRARSTPKPYTSIRPPRAADRHSSKAMASSRMNVKTGRLNPAATRRC